MHKVLQERTRNCNGADADINRTLQRSVGEMSYINGTSKRELNLNSFIKLEST